MTFIKTGQSLIIQKDYKFCIMHIQTPEKNIDTLYSRAPKLTTFCSGKKSGTMCIK